MGRRSDPRWRDTAAAGLLASVLPELGLAGRALVVDDPEAAVPEALDAEGLAVARWSRSDGVGDVAGRPWPPAGPFDAVLIRLPRVREGLDFALHAAASVTRPGGRILVYGASDEGIASTPRRMEALLQTVTQRANARRCRVLEGVRPAEATADPLGSLAAWRREGTVDLGWGPVPWVSYPGTFAAGRIDPGTALLLGHLPPVSPGDRVVDFGAGTGVLAAGLLHAAPGVEVSLVEPDALARAAAEENVAEARFLPLGDWSGAGPFRAVVSNPPYHLGKGESLEVVETLVSGSARGLGPEGELRLVVQRRLPVEALLLRHFGVVEALADGGPYRVWRAASPGG